TPAQNARDYIKVENAKGTFSFTQDVVSPSDEVFSLFGTALTGMCATPSFVLEKGEGESTMYVNVCGDIQKAYTVDLNEIIDEGRETTRIALCACSTSSATAVGEITGVRLSDVIQMADMADGVNAVKVVGSDGYGKVLPLEYALEKEAMIVYKVNGEDVPSATQFWVPQTVAKYFTRDVVNVELIKMDEVPAVDGRADEYRAQVNILNSADSAVIAVGDEISFEGYADDVGEAIESVEFSLDGGEHWTKYKTKDANSESWVYWNFSYRPEKAGDYKLTVRATTKSGVVSPLLSSVYFTVAEASIQAPQSAMGV
ncbi:MAG: molybdopterin-dependent oxidoreductase, partial [Clostridia bacterium]|nr:molybdopterin-dependent oxidoreductase [Clostridia bacterium]